MIFDHEARRHRVGASEVAAILGENPNCSPLDVWRLKNGIDAPFEGNAHTRRGNLQEAMILDWLEIELGTEILRHCKSYQYKDSLLWATPDGLAKFETLETCEGKSSQLRIHEIDDLPTSWIIQCQMQMLCMGAKRAHLAVYGPMISDFQHFVIDFNEAFALSILADLEEWWETHIVGDLQPEPISEADVLTLWPQDDGTTIDAVDEVYESICEHSRLKAQIKDLTDEIQPLRDRIVRAIGKAEKVRYNGRIMATYKTNAAGSRVFRTY